MNFYDQIKSIPKWVCWDYKAYQEWNAEALKHWDESTDMSFKQFTKIGKYKNPHKKPLQANGWGASSTDPSTWNTYEACSAKYSAGFVLTEEEQIVAVDLDHCRNKNGELTEYALYLLKLFSTGCEISQSEEGLHLFGYGRIPNAIKTKEIEVYSKERYICCTGNILLDLPLKNIQNALDCVYRNHKNKKIHKKINIERSIQISSSELDKFLENNRFRRLWDLEIEFFKDSGERDYSLYDFHIANILKDKQPEIVLGLMQKFRELHGFPKKHKGALVNAISKTNIWKKSKSMV